MLLVEFVLIYFIQQGVISWVESLVLIVLYGLYVLYLFKTMKGGHDINYEEPFTDKDRVSFLSAFMILDLKRMIIGNQKLNTKTNRENAKNVFPQKTDVTKNNASIFQV